MSPNYRRVLSRTRCVCETGCWERSQNASSFDFPPNLPFSATLRPGLTQPLEGLRNCSSFSVPADVMSLILMRFLYLPSSLFHSSEFGSVTGALALFFFVFQEGAARIKMAWRSMTIEFRGSREKAASRNGKIAHEIKAKSSAPTCWLLFY